MCRPHRETPRLRAVKPFAGQPVQAVPKAPLFGHGAGQAVPDLSIVLSGAERRFPLVAEAKILDASAAKTIRLYGETGIRRFVDGEYAWGNREAFMIGYVRDGSSIEETLTGFLSAADESHPQRYRLASLPVAVNTAACELARTCHERGFVYIGQTPPNNPGPISLWHLWLE